MNIGVSHKSLLSLAISPCVGAMSSSQWAVMLCGYGVKALCSVSYLSSVEIRAQ